jgi:hypothetical protein
MSRFGTGTEAPPAEAYDLPALKATGSVRTGLVGMDMQLREIILVLACPTPSTLITSSKTTRLWGMRMEF